jgi:hypothetical protein
LIAKKAHSGELFAVCCLSRDIKVSRLKASKIQACQMKRSCSLAILQDFIEQFDQLNLPRSMAQSGTYP